MPTVAGVKLFHSPAHARHAPRFFLQRGTVRPNYEIPARAEVLLEAGRAAGLDVATPPPASVAALAEVHAHAYLEFLCDGHRAWSEQPQPGPEIVANIHPAAEMLVQGGRPGTGIVARAGWFTADTACPIGEGTWEAALAAAGCALAAADEVAAGRHAYALCRPPGHHAYAARAGGHCYLNNAALAAQHLRGNGAARVAVLDIDAHHGNGTQGIFWERGDVFFASVHGDPDFYYPWYVGRDHERGAGAGAGANLNLPLARGSGDAAWLGAIETALAAIRTFRPEALVVSLGFDASETEPLGFLAVTAAGFARAGERIRALGVPAALVQEGGYDTATIGTILQRFLGGLG